MNLLIIEDEEILLSKYKSYTSSLFDNVYATSSIKEAVSVLENFEISCILSDNILPDGKGIDLISQVREEHADLPIVVITAYADKNLAISSINFKVTHFLEKPVGRDEIVATISKCIEIIKENQKTQKLYNKFELADQTKEELTQQHEISNRELEVIQILLHHNSTKAVAQKLFISPGTVKNHISNIFQKLHIASKEELKDLIYDLNKRHLRK